MANNYVHAGRRLRVLMAANHKAGDLVYEKGFFGVVQDDQTAGKFGTLILEGAWELARTPATVAAGTKVFAGPSSVATTLDLSVASTAYPIGRTIATGNASVARVQLFNPNSAY